MEQKKSDWANLSAARKAQFIAYFAVNYPYIVSKLLWYDFVHNHSKDIAVPKIGFGYDVRTGNLGYSLNWFVDISMDYERRLFGIKRKEFCSGGGHIGKTIKINSSTYLEEKILEENAPQIATVTFKIMPRNGDGSPVNYTLLENLTPNCEKMGLKPFPKPVLLAIKKNLDDIMLL